jgi:hypothetical protein
MHVDICDWYSRCTLDIIGKAGFGHDIAALEGTKPSQMAIVVKMIMQAGTRKPPYLIRLLIPLIPTLVSATI